MYASQHSNVRRVHLGTPQTDILVHLVRGLGPAQGFYGAKITGTGGTVAVLCDDSPACRDKLAAIAQDYAKQTGLTPNLFFGSSPGGAVDPTRLTATEMTNDE